MAIVSSLSSPNDDTGFACNADFHLILVWTNIDGKSLNLRFRYASGSSFCQISCNAIGDKLTLDYFEPAHTEVALVTSMFTADQEYRVDVYGNGTNIKVDVDDVEKINETVTYNQTEAYGLIDHGYGDTNTIEIESWPYGEPTSGVEFTVGNVGNSSIAALTPVTIAAATAFTVTNVGNSSIAGYNPNTVIGTGLWEVGAYIYDVIGEVHVNVGNAGDVGVTGFNPASMSADTTFTVGNVGGVSIAGKNPTVGLPTYINVLNVGAVAIAGFAASVLQAIEFTVSNVGRVVISGLNADVSEALSSAASGITRIAMKMATILRR